MEIRLHLCYMVNQFLCGQSLTSREITSSCGEEENIVHKKHLCGKACKNFVKQQ